METLLMTVEDTRAVCGRRGREWVYARIAAGDFQSVKQGGRRLLFADSVRAYVERLRNGEIADIQTTVSA